jgi:hypothetical protein
MDHFTFVEYMSLEVQFVPSPFHMGMGQAGVLNQDLNTYQCLHTESVEFLDN